MALQYDNRRTQSTSHIGGAEAAEQKSPLDLFKELYEKQNNQPMNERQEALASALIGKIWEGEA